MTTRTETMTVEEEVEVEVDICDHCGLGDDEDGLGDVVEFVAIEDRESGEPITEDIDYEPFHLHRPCYKDMALSGYEYPRLADVEINEGTVFVAWSLGELAMYLLGVGIASVAIMTDPTSVFSALFLFFGVGLTILGIQQGHSQAKSAIEEVLT